MKPITVATISLFICTAAVHPALAHDPAGYWYSPFKGGAWVTAATHKLHQYGPLYNYGPYYGYPPFEPYGPWNAYLQYNPYYAGGYDYVKPVVDKSGHGGLIHHLNRAGIGLGRGIRVGQGGGLFSSGGHPWCGGRRLAGSDCTCAPAGSTDAPNR